MHESTCKKVVVVAVRVAADDAKQTSPSFKQHFWSSTLVRSSQCARVAIAQGESTCFLHIVCRCKHDWTTLYDTALLYIDQKADVETKRKGHEHQAAFVHEHGFEMMLGSITSMNPWFTAKARFIF